MATRAPFVGGCGAWSKSASSSRLDVKGPPIDRNVVWCFRLPLNPGRLPQFLGRGRRSADGGPREEADCGGCEQGGEGYDDYEAERGHRRRVVHLPDVVEAGGVVQESVADERQCVRER